MLAELRSASGLSACHNARQQQLVPCAFARPSQQLRHPAADAPAGVTTRHASALQRRAGLPGRHAAAGQRRGSPLVVCAAVAHHQGTVVTRKQLTLRNGAKVQVVVEQEDDGSQNIQFDTDLQAARLLLHWGVEGGKDYKGGWRLPSQRVRPEGTVTYKDRALQSPFKLDTNGRQLITIHLDGDEASDVINFVLKDDATNTWYDNNSFNFRVELRPDVDVAAPPKVDQLPKELCDMWAWVRYDFAGRPPRSDDDSASEYERGVQEMRALLNKGRMLDELWRVAEGKWKYADYRKKVVEPELGKSTAPATAPPPKQPPPPPPPPAAEVKQEQKKQQEQGKAPAQLPRIPEDLLGVQAYVMWEKAGKPDGADFSVKAKAELEEQLRGGMTIDQICKKLNYTLKAPSPSASRSGGSLSSVDQASPSPAPYVKKASAPLQVGAPLGGTPKRNPLDLVKRNAGSGSAVAPKLSDDKRAPEKPMEFLVQQFAVDKATKWRRTYGLGNKAEMLAVVRQESNSSPIQLDIFTDLASEAVLHWGVCPPASRDWCMPEDAVLPEGSIVTHKAVDTPLHNCDSDECDVEISGAKVPLQRVTITLPPDHRVGAVTFVLRSADSTMWYKDAGTNFFIPVPSKGQPIISPDPSTAVNDDLSKAIIEAEVNTHQWTLMHRFNKAADLINEVLNGYYDQLDVAAAFTRIFIWLRYSATRHLTWQRNYNTQPRILSAAQERLTSAIANAHGRTSGEAQEWVRIMLTTVGRGGDGQKIRDEILNIMHRNNIPEKKGLWIEEWHQKLHNNTTPDDVPICQAYLAYLESNGNMGAYWRTLSDAGITRERLEGFDRPITLEPQWFDGKKDALIRDMRNYLGILKAVHSGADLQASASAVGNRIPGGARGYLAYVLSHIGDGQILPLLQACVEARTELAPALPGSRELLYLDLALEEQVRAAAERGVGVAGFGAAAFMPSLLQNLALSLGDNEELCYCLKAWNELPVAVRTGGRPSKEEALLAVAVVNRVRRALAEISDKAVNRMDAISRAYGRAFGVEPWAYEVFAEEVIRGGPAFAVSLVITAIEPTLRNAAALGAWQVISPIEATGLVEVVAGLADIQDKVFTTPTVLIAEQVTGEEEIPDGVVAVITPDAPDVLSHVSVRARNMRVFFATCHDDAPLKQLRDSAGKWLHFTPSASGAVSWAQVAEPKADAGGAGGADHHHDKPLFAKGLKIEVPTWCGRWVVGMDDYKDGVVGAKSKNLAKLRGKLPASIALPASVTLPFGSFEQVLELPENRAIKLALGGAVSRLTGKAPASSASGGSGLLSKVVGMVGLNGGSSSNGNGAGASGAGGSVNVSAVLSECRSLAMRVVVPKALRDDLASSMKAAGIPVPENEERWRLALDALRGVWASKYNDRAFYSLKKAGLNFDDVRMAVLVQRVVQPQYAFVIHTKNPQNNDENEIFCEMVKGLGESLVSGMVPGSAVAFKATKNALGSPEVLCYASKSEAMYVRDSLIFRSDSNGEDLEGYAGAGLYESITMDPCELTKVDYMEDKLVQDPKYRRDLLSRVCTVGYDIEKALGDAQDVEGVVDAQNKITVVQTRPQV